MTLSRRTSLAVGGVVGGAGLVAALMFGPLAAGTASAAVGGCSATAAVQSQWGGATTGGEIINVTVVNTSAKAAASWSVTWAPTGQVVSAWNATVTTSGGTTTAVNASHNGALAPGASTSFGMQLTGTAPAPVMSCSNDAVPTPGADVTVTLAENTQTVTLNVGQTLGVSLPNRFVPTKVNGPALSLLSATGGYPTGQPLAALYRAVAPGTVDVSSVSDDPCLHSSPPCAMPVQLWVVHVRVVDLPTGGQTVTVTTTDNTHTVSLHIGDTLVVSLPAMYVPPTVTSNGVLRPGNVAGGFPTGQPLVARYAAAAAGQADISTYTDSACNHAPTPCPSPSIRWVIHVIVTA